MGCKRAMLNRGPSPLPSGIFRMLLSRLSRLTICSQTSTKKQYQVARTRDWNGRRIEIGTGPVVVTRSEFTQRGVMSFCQLARFLSTARSESSTAMVIVSLKPTETKARLIKKDG